MNPEKEGAEAAARFRDEQRLGTQPLGDLVAIIEQATSIDVAVLDAGPDEHGLTMRDPERGTVFIGVARTGRPMRQRSTLAHELAHVLFEDWGGASAGTRCDRPAEEVRADVFARHLLIPIEGLRAFLGDRESADESTLSSVVQRFLVSPQIAAIALHQAQYIDTATKQEWMAHTAPRLATRFGWIDHYRALQDDSGRPRAPQRLLARAVRGYAEGVLSAQAIATLRGVPLAEVEEELRAAGIAPTSGPVSWDDPVSLPEVDIDLTDLEAVFAAQDPRTDSTASEPEEDW